MNNVNVITFPHLGIQFEINPVIDIPFLNIDIHWYGVIIVFGILLTPIFAKFRLKHVGLTMDDVLDLLIFCLPSALLGCRLYYCLFKDFDYYIKNPLKIITEIVEGGLAFYGGLIGALLVGFLVMKFKKKSFFDATDLAMPMFLLAQGIGRWGNFVNGEAHGTPTDLPWGMVVDAIYKHNSTNGVAVHPCFLYESISCLIGFAVLYFIIFPRRKFKGELTACYMVWYGIERFFVEGLRTDSLRAGQGSLRISQGLSLVLVLGGITWLILGFIHSKKHPLTAGASQEEEYESILKAEPEELKELDERDELQELDEIEETEIETEELDKLEENIE